MNRMKRIHKVLVIVICLLLSALSVVARVKSSHESKNLIGNYQNNDVVTEQQIKENKDD